MWKPPGWPRQRLSSEKREWDRGRSRLLCLWAQGAFFVNWKGTCGMVRKIGLAGACLTLAFSLCACGPREAAAPSSGPTPSPVPTALPRPTPTPTQTPSRAPRDTPEPESTPEMEYLLRDTIQAPIDYPLSGELWRYNSLEEDGWLFEWVMSDETVALSNSGQIWEQKLLISRVTDSGPVFVQEFAVEDEWLEYAMMPGMGGMAYADADFDGEKDILLCLGSYGAQGLLRFAAFLQRESGFEACESFAEIANPAIDDQKQLILGTWRNSAVSHGYGAYEYRDGEYVELRVLTEGLTPDSPREEDKAIWQWTVTENGQTTVLARSDEYTAEELDDLIYNENSEWNLSSKRWWGIFSDSRD